MTKNIRRSHKLDEVTVGRGGKRGVTLLLITIKPSHKSGGNEVTIIQTIPESFKR